MLAPRASSAFVCLRCELTLARPRLSLLSRRPPHAAFSASTRRHDASDEASPSEQSQSRLSAHPFGRVRRRKGRAVRETTARLDGTTTLGEDASIIVLEELSGEAKAEDANQNAAQVEVANDGIPLNLADAVTEAPATLDEVVDQLDNLRSKATNRNSNLGEGDFVRQAVFVDLSKVLLRSFTGTQLAHYYSVKKNVGQDRVASHVIEGLHQLQRKSKRPDERSEWTPGTSQINRRLPGLAVHQSHKRKPISKHLLVDQILRDVWRLETLEEFEATGEIEIVLKDWQLALLTSGAPETTLDRIGKTRMVKFETSAADKVLRITADKSAAEYAADDVELLLQSTEVVRFHVKTWEPYLKLASGAETTFRDVFPDHVLQTVGALTGVYLQPSTDAIIMRGLNKETVAEAERCLIKMLPRRSTQFTVDRSGVPKDQKHFVPVALDKESVDYELREAKLGRWSLPVAKKKSSPLESDSPTERIQSTQAHIAEMAPAILTEGSKTPKNVPNKSLWEPQAEHRLRAMFGHVLHPLGDPTTQHPHFVPALPGLTSVFKHRTFKPYFTTNPSLTYEFISNPKKSDAESTQFEYPALSVTFRPDKLGQYYLQKMNISFGWVRHYVLLPEEVVDMSFAFGKTLRLQDRSQMKWTFDWEREVLKNLQSGKRLIAPELELDIPNWTVEGMGYSTKKDLTRAHYLFTGVKINQSMWGAYHGVAASYSTSQSGKLSAKKGTFSIPYGVSANSKKILGLDPKEALDKFVADAYMMAGKITEAAASSGTGMRKITRSEKTPQVGGNSTAPASASGVTASSAPKSEDAWLTLDKEYDDALSVNNNKPAVKVEQPAENNTETSSTSSDVTSPVGQPEPQPPTENEEFTKKEEGDRQASSA